MFTVEGRKKGFLNSIIGPGANPIREMVNHNTSEKVITLSPEDVFESVEAIPVFAGTSFEREATDSLKRVEPMPVFSGANRVVIDSREGTDSANVITLASGTVREGADTDSYGTSQKGVPFLAFPSNSSQISQNIVSTACRTKCSSTRPHLEKVKLADSVGSDDSEGNDTDALVSELAVSENDNASANATFASAAVGSNTTIRPSYISRWSDSDFNNCVSDWGKSNDEIDWDAITNGDINGEVD
jgi:hypothetical protein